MELNECKICCKKALEIMVRNVKSIEDLELIERSIEDYETEYDLDLGRYKKFVNDLRYYVKAYKKLGGEKWQMY